MDVLYQDACMCFCVCGVFACVMRRKLQSLVVWVILYNIAGTKENWDAFWIFHILVLMSGWKSLSIFDTSMLLQACLCMCVPLLLGVMVWTPDTVESDSSWIYYSPSYLFFVFFFFFLVAVIDRAIWRCLAFHHLWGCQWLGIKILYIGLIFQKFVFFITWPLHSASLSTLLVWVMECLSTYTPSELLYVSGYMSQAQTTYNLFPFSHFSLRSWTFKYTAKPPSSSLLQSPLPSASSPSSSS